MCLPEIVIRNELRQMIVSTIIVQITSNHDNLQILRQAVESRRNIAAVWFMVPRFNRKKGLESTSLKGHDVSAIT